MEIGADLEVVAAPHDTASATNLCVGDEIAVGYDDGTASYTYSPMTDEAGTIFALRVRARFTCSGPPRRANGAYPWPNVPARAEPSSTKLQAGLPASGNCWKRR